MTAPACQRAREVAAVDLLTHAGWDDGLSTHLRGCPACRAEVDGMAPVAGALAILKSQGAGFRAGTNGTDPAMHAGTQDEHPPAPDELLDRVLAAAASRRRRRRWLAPLAAAAAVLALAVPAAIWLDDDPPDPTPTAAAPAEPIMLDGYDGESHVTAQVELRGTAAGSKLSARISGVRTGTDCAVRVVSADGTREVAASWVVSYSPASEGVGTLTGSVPVPLAELASVEIVDSGTDTVLLKIKM